MIEWDLYLDESGAFKKKGEHTLIGGFLLPHHQVNKNMFEEWRRDIRNRIEDAKTITKQQLDDGDRRLQLDFKKKRNAFSEDDQQKLKQIHQRGYYAFDHCNDNKKQAFRWSTQRWVLEQYMEKIRSAKGYPVIFDNPRGVYHVDSNTTFMSIMANGLIRLYNDLKKRDPNKKIVLYIHAAFRTNITRRDQKDCYEISPVKGEQYILDKGLYINQIKNLLFLNGGQELLELKEFQDSLERFELLDETQPKEYMPPHPATVVCDYICNSFYASNGHRGLETVLKEGGVQIFNVFNGPLSSIDYGDDLLAQNHDWGR